MKAASRPASLRTISSPPTASPAAPACRPARPRPCQEKSVVELGTPQRSVLTTCAYCGVGCSFKAELQGEKSRPHGAVQGWRRERGPFLRQGPFRLGLRHAHRPHHHADGARCDHRPLAARSIGTRPSPSPPPASKRSRQSTAPGAIGGITSSRCTNEEVYVVQKMIRAAFGNNNVDTCARVCHSPTGYGLKQTFGTSAGTQDFKSVESADVILLIGANPTDAHPVFASRMKKRLRAGAKSSCAIPAASIWCARPHMKAAHHLQLRPGTNVALMNAIGHTIVTEGLVDEAFVAERCEDRRLRRAGAPSLRRSATARKRWPRRSACMPPTCAPPPASTPPAATGRSITAWA